MRTDELIVQLARAAGPVRPLPGPSVRLARWTAAAVPMTALGVIVIGPRADVLTAIHQPTFVGLAAATLGHGPALGGRRVRAERPGRRALAAAAGRAARGRRRMGAGARRLVDDRR